MKLVTSIYEAATAYIATKCMRDGKEKNIRHLHFEPRLRPRRIHISWLHNMYLGIRCGFVRLVIIKQGIIFAPVGIVFPV